MSSTLLLESISSWPRTRTSSGRAFGPIYTMFWRARWRRLSERRRESARSVVWAIAPRVRSCERWCWRLATRLLSRGSAPP